MRILSKTSSQPTWKLFRAYRYVNHSGLISGLATSTGGQERSHRLISIMGRQFVFCSRATSTCDLHSSGSWNSPIVERLVKNPGRNVITTGRNEEQLEEAKNNSPFLCLLFIFLFLRLEVWWCVSEYIFPRYQVDLFTSKIIVSITKWGRSRGSSRLVQILN